LPAHRGTGHFDGLATTRSSGFLKGHFTGSRTLDLSIRRFRRYPPRFVHGHCGTARGLMSAVKPSMILAVKVSEPRRHRYVPSCWLGGFTDTGEKDGLLWVTDLVRRRQWRTSPYNAGHIRDYYLLSDEQLDPLIIERSFSKIEGLIAPGLRGLDREQRAPGVEEFSPLLPFIALQWARPSFRPMVFNVLDFWRHPLLNYCISEGKTGGETN